MMRSGHRGPKRALRDLLGFAVAYVITAYFAAPAHPTFADALLAHASLFLVSMLLWYSQAFWVLLFRSSAAAATDPHVLMLARLLSWLILVTILVNMMHPDQLDQTELAIYSATILLLFVGSCLLQFSPRALIPSQIAFSYAVIFCWQSAISSVRPSSRIGFLNLNTVRGSPA